MAEVADNLARYRARIAGALDESLLGVANATLLDEILRLPAYRQERSG